MYCQIGKKILWNERWTDDALPECHDLVLCTSLHSTENISTQSVCATPKSASFLALPKCCFSLVGYFQLSCSTGIIALRSGLADNPWNSVEVSQAFPQWKKWFPHLFLWFLNFSCTSTSFKGIKTKINK